MRRRAAAPLLVPTHCPAAGGLGQSDCSLGVSNPMSPGRTGFVTLKSEGELQTGASILSWKSPLTNTYNINNVTSSYYAPSLEGKLFVLSLCSGWKSTSQLAHTNERRKFCWYFTYWRSAKLTFLNVLKIYIPRCNRLLLYLHFWVSNINSSPYSQMPSKRKPQPLAWSLYKIEEERKCVAMRTKKRIEELGGPTEALRAPLSTYSNSSTLKLTAFLFIVLCHTFLSGLARTKECVCECTCKL